MRVDEWEQRRMGFECERRLLQQDVVRAQWHESRAEVVRQPSSTWVAAQLPISSELLLIHWVLLLQ